MKKVAGSFACGIMTMAIALAAWPLISSGAAPAGPAVQAPAGGRGAPPATQQPALTLTPKNANGMYAAGEKAVWTVTRGANSTVPSATYTVRKNGVVNNNQPYVAQGTIDLSTGSGTIEVGFGEPGSLFLEVTPAAVAAPAGQPTDPAAAAPGGRGAGRGRGGPGGGRIMDGAMIAADQIKPAVARPDDFDAWWESKVNLLKDIPINPQLTTMQTTVEGVDLFQVKLDSVGSKVQGYLAKPKAEGKYPAILLYQYAGVYALPTTNSTNRARQGWLAFNVDSHDIPPDSATGVSANYQSIGNSDRETSYFLNMYLRDTRAIQYIMSRPDWDGKTIVVIGDSMGGQQSLVTAGLNPQVTHMLVLVPSGADVGAQTVGRAAAYPTWPVNQEPVLKTARYFDTVNFASRIKATSLVAFGLYDETSPPIGVNAAYNLIQGPKELLPLHSGHQNQNNSQKPYQDRREEWLSALVKGQPVPIKK